MNFCRTPTSLSSISIILVAHLYVLQARRKIRVTKAQFEVLERFALTELTVFKLAQEAGSKAANDGLEVAMLDVEATQTQTHMKP